MIDAPATTTFAIRPLTIEELPLCVPFGPSFMQEYDLPGVFNPDVFLKNWRYFLQSLTAVLYGLWDEGRVVGGIGGLVHPDLNTGDLHAVECFWYVDPAYRNTLMAGRLPLTFKKWGKRHGAVRWKMIHLLAKDENPSTVKLAGFYERACKLKANEVVFDGPL